MKRLLFVLCFAVLVFTGCSNESITDVSEKVEQPENDTNTSPHEETKESTEPQEQPQETTDSKEIVGEKIKETTTSPKYKINESTWSVEPIEKEGNEKLVLLTIDDAPDKYSLEMANTLKELGVNAIFFVNGHFIDTKEEQARLKEIYDMGFAIGNHTYNHQKLDDVSEEKQREEIVKLNALIEEVTGERPKFFRAPHGVNTDFSTQLAKEEGMVLMNWTYGYDYFKPYMNADKLTTAMVTGEGPEVDVPYSLLKPGANLLMHDRDWTNAALTDIVKGLQDKGYEVANPNLIQTIPAS